MTREWSTQEYLQKQNLLEPWVGLFQLYHWLSEIQSLRKNRPTVDLGQPITPNRVRAKCYQIRGWDFILIHYTLTKEPVLNLTKGNGSLYNDCTVAYASGFSSTKYLSTCLTAININWDWQVLKKSLSLRIDWSSSLRQSLNSLPQRVQKSVGFVYFLHIPTYNLILLLSTKYLISHHAVKITIFRSLKYRTNKLGTVLCSGLFAILSQIMAMRGEWIQLSSILLKIHSFLEVQEQSLKSPSNWLSANNCISLLICFDFPIL